MEGGSEGTGRTLRTEGRERDGGAVRCAVARCGEPAEVVVAHPHRPEPETAVCVGHAVTVVVELGGGLEGSV